MIRPDDLAPLRHQPRAYWHTPANDLATVGEARPVTMRSVLASNPRGVIGGLMLGVVILLLALSMMVIF